MYRRKSVDGVILFGRLFVKYFIVLTAILSFGLFGCSVSARDRRLICSKCGCVISGSYYKMSDGSIVCPNDSPKCFICGEICTDRYYILKSGRTICAKDMDKQIPACSCCHRKPTDAAIVRLRDNLVSCSQCWNSKLPRCFLCNLPISSGGLIFSDGRHLCPYHSASAINDQHSAEIYFDKAKQLIKQYVSPSINIDDASISIHIVDKNVLCEKMRSGGDPSPSLELTSGRTLQYKIGGRMLFRIYVLQGLPSEDFLTTMVHECGHVWQMKNIVTPLSQRRQEGFCEWLAYKVNNQLHRQTQIQLLEAKNDNVYHKGLLEYLDLEKRRGRSAVLSYALGK
ncbi:MAG: hypothetical protein ACI376_06275 [Candidatus Bruticola sp.]